MGLLIITLENTTLNEMQAHRKEIINIKPMLRNTKHYIVHTHHNKYEKQHNIHILFIIQSTTHISHNVIALY